jgi:hypothetical protein
MAAKSDVRSRGTSLKGSELGGVHPKVSEVHHSQMCSMDKLSQIAPSDCPDVLEDLVRRAWLGVAVVPRQLDQLE